MLDGIVFPCDHQSGPESWAGVPGTSAGEGVKQIAYGVARVVQATLARTRGPTPVSLVFRVGLHAIIPGRVWRSAQPDAATLRRLIDELGLAAVISLRGDRTARSWLADERAVCAEAGVRLCGVRFTASSAPMPEVLRQLTDLIATTPRPLLIHCRKGIDRSGLAAALTLLFEGRSPERARAQLGPRHGFHAWARGPGLRVVLDEYEAWLARHQRTHTPADLRAWIDGDYASVVRWSNWVGLRRALDEHTLRLDARGLGATLERRGRVLRDGLALSSDERTFDAATRFLHDVERWRSGGRQPTRVCAPAVAGPALRRALGKPAEDVDGVLAALARAYGDGEQAAHSAAAAALHVLDPDHWGLVGWRQLALRPLLDEHGTVAAVLASPHGDAVSARRRASVQQGPPAAERVREMQRWYRQAATREGVRAADVSLGVCGLSLRLWPAEASVAGAA